MTYALASLFRIYIQWINVVTVFSVDSILINSVLNVKALAGAFNQKKAFSVIVKLHIIFTKGRLKLYTAPTHMFRVQCLAGGHGWSVIIVFGCARPGHGDQLPRIDITRSTIKIPNSPSVMPQTSPH